MDFLNLILWITLIIFLIIFFGLFFGIQISLILNKKDSKIDGILKIIIFEKITILTQEIPSKEDSEKIKKDSFIKKFYNKIKKIIPKRKKDTSTKEKKDLSLTELLKIIKPLIPKIRKIIPRFINLFRNILNSIEIKKFYMHIDLGLNSCVETAKIVGYYWGFASILNTVLKPCSISAQPIFIEERFDLNIDIDVKIKLLKIIPGFLRLIINKDIIDLIKDLIQIYRENYA